MESPQRRRTWTRRAWLATTASAGAASLWAPSRPASAAPAAPVIQPWPDDRPAPALALTDLDGRPWRLAALRGHPVLLNFWATWCEPCRREMPSLQALAARERATGLAVVSVNYRETAPAIRDFLAHLPLSLPILLDVDGEVAGAWTRRVFPTTVLVDRDGVPRTSVVGELDWSGDSARALLEPLLAPHRRT